MKRKNSFRKLWGKPFIIGIITLIGLLSALIGDYLWDGLSWLMLSIPVLVVLFFFCRSKTT